MKKTNTALSVKMNKDEIAMIERKAKECGETKSRYTRRVLMESIVNPFYTGEDVMRLLIQIGHDFQRMNKGNIDNTIDRFNRTGEEICRILSSK